jgi:dTDP-4-dehydrorhamnose reductase
MPGPLLIVGGDSEIGVAAAEFMRRRGHAVAVTTRRRNTVAADRPFLDLSIPFDDAWAPPRGARAAYLCAAVARLGDCAADPAASALVNVTRTLALADRLLAHGVPLVFLSTDKVFDGTRASVPAEAPTCPISEYGRQKAAAEAALRELMARGAPVAILRLAKIVSPGMTLLRQWKADLAGGKPIRAFFDMMMAPTPVSVVAAALECLLCEPITGVFQLSGPRDVAYSAVAERLAGKLGADRALVQPVSAYTAGLPEGSTARHTTLDSTALRERFGIAVADAWEVMDDIIESCP